MKNRAAIFWIAGLTAVIVLATVIFLASRPAESSDEDYFNDPKTTVIFEQSEFDIGDVRLGAIVNTTCTVKNTGDNTLLIYYIDPGCSCTSYSVSNKKVAPDGTSEITLSLDTAKKPKGAFLIYATIRMNTKEETHPLVIRGNIVE